MIPFIQNSKKYELIDSCQKSRPVVTYGGGVRAGGARAREWKGKGRNF